MPEIIAVASGKGGVGKSFFSANLAMSLSASGKRVLLVDLDLGGANLHNFVGLRVPGVGLYNFLKERADIEDCIIKTPAGIDFIGGSGDILGMAHVSNYEKMKILDRLRRLDYTNIVIDLGAGSSFNIVDFYNHAQKKLIVLNSEPTSIENAYGFLKVAVYRRIERMLSKDHRFEEVCLRLRSKSMNFSSVDAIKEAVAGVDPGVNRRVDAITDDFKTGMVLNMVKFKKELNVYYGFANVTRKYLSIQVEMLGFIPYDIQVSESLKALKPQYVNRPESETMRAIDDIREVMAAKL